MKNGKEKVGKGVGATKYADAFGYLGLPHAIPRALSRGQLSTVRERLAFKV